MPRCPDCNKFASLDKDEAETDRCEMSGAFEVEAAVRIVNKCADCGTELAEATVELEGGCEDEYLAHLMEAGVDVGADDFDPDKVTGHDLECDDGDPERDESGGSRYAKNYQIVRLGVTLKCSCGKWEHELELEGRIAASEMDSLV